MKIRYVTLTGADDKTNASEMKVLSNAYPYVEWAILFSQNKTKAPRYPSYDWVERNLPQLMGCQLSAHLCGRWVDDAMKGELTFMDIDDGVFFSFFDRIQLNLSGERLNKFLNGETKLWNCDLPEIQIILGGPYQKCEATFPTHAYLSHGAVPLFDCSGGRGILTKNWPKVIEGEGGVPLLCGYAGGLGPENLEEQLKKIEEVVGDNEIWIDMENNIRTNNVFDLKKCEKVLKIAENWV